MQVESLIIFHLSIFVIPTLKKSGSEINIALGKYVATLESKLGNT